MYVNKDSGLITVLDVKEAVELENLLTESVVRCKPIYQTAAYDFWCKAQTLRSFEATSHAYIDAFTRRLGLALTKFWRARAGDVAP